MIYGKRIRLRAIEREDLPAFVEWLNDPEVIAGLVFHVPMSLEDEGKWFEGLSNRPAEERPLCIEVKTGEGWHMIGDMGLHNIEWTQRAAEMGIMIGDKSYWNQGYGTEAMTLLLKYGFETLNLNRMYLRVYETNLRAIRAYEKAGFVHEGRLRQALYADGKYHDGLVMSVLRSEWDARKTK